MTLVQAKDKVQSQVQSVQSDGILCYAWRMCVHWVVASLLHKAVMTSNGQREWGSSASCSGIAAGLQKMFIVSMEGLSIYYYSTVCPMVSLLIRIMIYIKNHKGSMQVRTWPHCACVSFTTT